MTGMEQIIIEMKTIRILDLHIGGRRDRDKRGSESLSCGISLPLS